MQVIDTLHLTSNTGIPFEGKKLELIVNVIGDKKLLDYALIALFCSRKCPGDSILKAYDFAYEVRDNQTPIIGGFHSKIEKNVLSILLHRSVPVVICLARSLKKIRIPVEFRLHIDSGQLLLLSIAKRYESRITTALAEQRNRLVAALASQYYFIHVEPGGSLEPLYQEIKSRFPERIIHE